MKRRFARLRLIQASLLAAGLVFVACTKKAETTGAPETAEQIQAKLADRGRSIYMSSCIACHNANPKIDGNVGPAIAGSSLELITARVMKAEYPPGYKPKRETHVMAALPHLQPELASLHAFLNAP